MMKPHRSGPFAWSVAVSVLLSLSLAAGARGESNPALNTPNDVVGEVVGTVISALLADSSCDSGKGCLWTQPDYDGSKAVFGTADAGTSIILGSFDESAKNEFGSRRMRFFAQDGDLLSCINAGNHDRSLPGRTYRLEIGASGSTC